MVLTTILSPTSAELTGCTMQGTGSWLAIVALTIAKLVLF
jgi:hypothetical protein